MDEELKALLLTNQLVLHKSIMKLSESELKELLESEQKKEDDSGGKGRIGYFDRMYGRFSKERKARETAEWLRGEFK